MLNYLNDTLGDGFIAMGSVLVVIGVIMLCSINFSILLLFIIDEASKIEKIENEMNHKTNLKAVNPNIPNMPNMPNMNMYQNRILVVPGNMNFNAPKY